MTAERAGDRASDAAVDAGPVPRVAPALGAFVAEHVPVPEPVLHEAARSLVNVLASSLAAVAEPISRLLKAWAAEDGGPARLLWDARHTSAERAATVNAAMMHALDFDDTHRPTFCHPAPAVAAALLADAATRTVNGHQLLDALTVGIEVELAVAEMLFPSHYSRGFHITPTTGCIGAAAGCARLRGLDAERSAAAIATSMATSSGLIEMLGTMTNAFAVGQAARNGLVSAELAERGLTAAPTAFEGDKGLLRAASDESPARIASALSPLGRRWRIREVSYKRFATETITQAPIEAALSARRRTAEADRERLESIEILAKPIVRDVIEQRAHRVGPRPTTLLEARFDIRFCVATAWVRGRFAPFELDEATLEDRAILAVREQVRVIARPDHLGNDIRAWFAFANGTVVEEYVRAFTGSADNPFSDDDLRAKLLEAAAGLIDGPRVARIADLVWNLDGLEPIEPLLSELKLDLDDETRRA